MARDYRRRPAGAAEVRAVVARHVTRVPGAVGGENVVVEAREVGLDAPVRGRTAAGTRVTVIRLGERVEVLDAADGHDVLCPRALRRNLIAVVRLRRRAA